MAKKMKMITTANDELNRVQQNIRDSVDPLLALPVVNCILTDRITIAAGAFGANVAHGLGRKPLCWSLVSPEADSTLWQNGEPDEKFISVSCSTAGEFSFRLLVY